MDGITGAVVGVMTAPVIADATQGRFFCRAGRTDRFGPAPERLWHFFVKDAGQEMGWAASQQGGGTA